MNKLKKKLSKNECFSTFDHEIEINYPVESSFTWRIFQRMVLKKGKEILENKENPYQYQTEEWRVWNNSIRINSEPPIFKEYKNKYAEWDLEGNNIAFADIEKKLKMNLISSDCLSKTSTLQEKESLIEEKKKKAVKFLLFSGITTALSLFCYFYLKN